MSNTARIAATAANTLTKPLNVEEVFSTYLLDGSGTITNGIDLAGEGGLLWTKWRSGGALSFYQNHFLYDTERGYGSTDYLHSNNTDAAGATGAIGSGSFNSDGFTTGGNVFSGNEWASWTFRKAPKFFDVVTYTGDGTLRNIPHNLGSVPGTIIVKRTDGAGNWYVQHRSTGPTKSLFLDTTTAATTRPEWGNTAPTDSVFTVDGTTVTATNYNGFNYVAYLFAHNDGDGEFGPDGDADIIKCGSYTGTGSSGNFVDLGFEPQFMLIKNTSSTANWIIHDNMRGMIESTGNVLFPNLSAAENTTAFRQARPNATGITFFDGNSETNGSGSNYIYIAIRRGPMAVPESATDVFAIDTQSGGGEPSFTSGFVVDMGIESLVSSASNRRISSRLTQGKALETNTTDADLSSTGYAFDYQNGWFYDGGSNADKYSWMWKRAPNYFDVVAYTGSGNNTNVKHNLGVTPELCIAKARTTTGIVDDWYVWSSHSGDGNDTLGFLNSSGTSALGFHWASPTSTDLYLHTNVAYSGTNYIQYLFASLDGVSKVGSYTGNGSTQTIDCGFSSGARFVLIKRTNDSSNWALWDSERGIVSGNDPYLMLNVTNAEVTSTDIIDPDNSGFIVNAGGNVLTNNNGDTYIFYAIA